MIFIIGGRGRLGQAIARQYDPSQVVSLDRSVYEHWGKPGASDAVTRYFAPYAGTASKIFVTSGLLDPKSSVDALHEVNFMLPRNVIDGVAGHGIPVTTFGTVMETLLADRNPYVASKAVLADTVAEQVAGGAPLTHIRVHTLYGGGMPSRFMFLGQILSAIETASPFKMTLGRQLREYHHVDDDAHAVRLLSEGNARGVFDLSHGSPISLRRLAETVFDAFDATDLLEIGAIPEPREENYDTVFVRHSLIEQMVFRDALPGVVTYLAECGAKKKY
jgi:nucleoside-diphosphate-sugar epimerase